MIRNKWCLFVISYRGGDKSIASNYIVTLNGTVLPTGSLNLGEAGGLANTNTIGIDSPANGYLFGFLDEVRIYNRALSDSEIQTLYSATK